MKKYIKALIYILNSIAGITLMLAFCMVGYESLGVALAMFIVPSAWLIGYGLIHDWLIDREKGGAKRVYTR